MFEVKIDYSKQFVAEAHDIYKDNANMLALVDGGDFSLGEAILAEATAKKDTLTNKQRDKRYSLFIDWEVEAYDEARRVFEKPAKSVNIEDFFAK